MSVYQVDTITTLAAQVEVLTKKLESMGSSSVMIFQMVTCDLCYGVGHLSVECQVGNLFSPSTEQVNYVGNF